MVAKEGWLLPQCVGKPSWLSEPGERGREETSGENRAGPHLQQPLQAATESVQLSAGVCHPMPTPVALEDGRDSSCEEDGGHQTSGVRSLRERLPRPLTSPSVQSRKLSWDSLTFQVPGDLKGSPLFCHEYLKMI